MTIRATVFKRLSLLIILLAFLAASGCSSVREQARLEVQPAFPTRNLVGDLGKLESDLSKYMVEATETELVPVILIMQRQITDEEKEKLFSDVVEKDKKLVKDRKRKALSAELKRIARKDQARVVEFLKALEEKKQVANLRPLWISNVIGVKAPKTIIKRLTDFREIKSIHLDVPRPVKGQVWSVTQIQADQVWSLSPASYNGKGATVAILDTGADYNHSDLRGRMWINAAEDINGDGQFTAADNNGTDDDGNGYIDDVVGWNFSGVGSNDPADVNGHGTHVAGSVAGDGTGGTRTGVAPGARIMALRESNTIALSTQQECWDGMQYALDNGADIINFSSGWLDTWNPVYSTWRDTVKNLMDAGVLFVTIAHNDGNATGAPNNVRTPGRVPLAVTLGATDDTDTIAGFSNNGPVTWQAVAPYFDYPWPPGLLKPDISAPGVGVNSTTMGGGYSGNTWDGTSMAAPHASGVAALLLDKDPGLSPYDIKFIIEETAVDLGNAGPDNVYGWGRVDALAAVNQTISSTPYDLSVTGTNAVWTSTDIWVDNNDDGSPDTPVALSNNHLYTRIRNIGGQVVSDVEVKFYYANVSTIGISGFDPNGDGDPADGNFTYIGSYRVPTLGPSGSHHDEAVALVNWNIPVPPGTHWCVGIGIVAHNPPNAVETNTLNNTAFKNFFNIITSAAAFDFKINPNPKAPTEPFGVEIVKQNLPREVEIELVFNKALEKRLMVSAKGLVKVKDPLLDRKSKPLGDKYYEVLEKEIGHVRYQMERERAMLAEIVSPKGTPIPVKILVTMPENVEVKENMLLIINTLGAKGEPVGGLTLNVIKRKALAK